MIARRICTLLLPRFLLLAFVLIAAAAFCQVDSGAPPLTASEYRAQLDRLATATDQLDSSGSAVPEELHHLPQSWRVQARGQASLQNEARQFEISTEGLQRDIRRYEHDRSADNALAIRRRLESLRQGIDGYQKTPADVSASRSALNSILARPEFREVQAGPTLLERVRDYILELLFNLLRRIFHTVSIPIISRTIVYALIGAAVLFLAYVLYRSFWHGQQVEEIVPKDFPVSAKEWAKWLSEARAAAAKSEWRDAIHLAYWAGISFLERQGFWKPDRARTPREYLRLLSGRGGAENEQRETLTALTRIFELAWYAKRDADESAFSQTLAQLEKLGCR
jgi:hypothetical protein